MAITAEARAEIISLVVGMFDAAPSTDILNNFVQSSEAGQSLEEMASGLAESAEFKSIYADWLTNEEFAEKFVSNILVEASADTVAEAEAFVAGQLNAGADRGEVILSAVQALNAVSADDENWGASAQALSNKVTVATYYSVDMGGNSNDLAELTAVLQNVDQNSDVSSDAAIKELIIGAEVSDDAIELTASTDRMTGTAGDDQFNAFMSQNPFAGGVSNTLSSADKLDGQGGTDTLFAEIVAEFVGVTSAKEIDVQPQTEEIEIVEFEARDLNAAAGGTVTVDAKHMTDIEKIGSKESDGDLVIENLTTLTSGGQARATSEITVTMDHTDNFNSDGDASDLTVYFDEDYLLTTTNFGNSSIIFRMMNQDAYDINNGENRLQYVYVERMEFELDGVRYDLAAHIEEDPEGTGEEFLTETALVEYLNATALPALAAANPEAAEAINSLEFTVGGNWNDGNQNRIGQEIVLTASNQYTLETKDAWLTLGQAEDVEPGFASNRIERTDVNTGENTTELAVNVELHKVGREGEGGDLVIGGKELDSNTPGTTEGNGIDIFNISVLGADNKPSNVGAISSTNDALDIINIETDAAYANGETFASLTIRDGFGIRTGGVVAQEVLEAVNADSFKGDLTIGNDTDVLNLGTLNAGGGGNVEFHADVTVDGAYDYNTGTGNDTIDLDISTESIDRVDTSIDVSTGGGTDSVMLYTDVEAATGTGHASQQTMELFKNMNVSTAAGDDTVVVGGDGRFYIDTAGNDDYVYINSQTMTGTVSATDAAIAGTTGTWNFGRVSDSVAKDFADTVLYSASLTLTFAGLESTVTVNTDAAGNFIADQLIINAAIAEAISQSPELSKLLTVSYDDGDQLMIVQSTVDGENDLAVSVSQPDVVTTGATGSQVLLSTGELDELVGGLMKTGVAGIDSSSTSSDVAGVLNANTITVEAANNGGSSDATGASNVNFSVIDMGAGSHDLLVMDSNELSSNVLVINETFGKTTVVNFHDNAPLTGGGATVGEHAIDFTHYLSDTTDSSNNSNNLSETAVAVTLNADANGDNFSSNSVNMIVNLSETTTDTFDSLTDTALLNALNGTDDFANIGESNPIDQADLVGSNQNYIVMVENPDNAGEYKVFHLTSSANATAFSAATELGILDFGDSINFNLVGSTDYTSEVEALINAADGGTALPTYSLASDVSAVDEGSTVTFTLSTTEVAEGETFDYTISGVDAADVTGDLTGTATVGADGTATVTVSLVEDATTEGEETLSLTVAGESASVTVNDTSVDGSTPTNEVTLNVGTSETTAADAAEDEVFVLDVTAAEALEDNTVLTVTGFDTVADSLKLDVDAAAPGVTTVQGLVDAGEIVSAQSDPFADAVVINLGTDGNGDGIFLTVTGTQDASAIEVTAL